MSRRKGGKDWEENRKIGGKEIEEIGKRKDISYKFVIIRKKKGKKWSLGSIFILILIRLLSI